MRHALSSASGFGIDAVIVAASMGPDLARQELVAAVCNAGGFAILQAQMCPPDLLRRQIHHLRTLTDMPFGVNFVLHFPHVAGQISTMVLLPRIVGAVAPALVLAAGGMADARGLAAALCLGADGVVLGTRFLAAPEANAHAEYKARLPPRAKKTP